MAFCYYFDLVGLISSFVDRKYAPRCCVCSEPIMPAPGQEETVRIVALDRDFHVQCYRCEVCSPRVRSHRPTVSVGQSGRTPPISQLTV